MQSIHGFGSPIVTGTFAVQPASSVIVKLYVPAPKPVIQFSWLLIKITGTIAPADGEIDTVYSGVPPVIVKQTFPSFTPHNVASVGFVSTTMSAGAVIVNEVELGQSNPSFTKTWYVPATNPATVNGTLLLAVPFVTPGISYVYDVVLPEIVIWALPVLSVEQTLFVSTFATTEGPLLFGIVMFTVFSQSPSFTITVYSPAGKPVGLAPVGDVPAGPDHVYVTTPVLPVTTKLIAPFALPHVAGVTVGVTTKLLVGSVLIVPFSAVTQPFASVTTKLKLPAAKPDIVAVPLLTAIEPVCAFPAPSVNV